MKVSVLVCEMVKGDLITKAAKSVAPLLDAAKLARVTGLLDGVPVKAGCVTRIGNAGLAYRFKCENGVLESASKAKKAKSAKE